jgi:hypothetical protein
MPGGNTLFVAWGNWFPYTCAFITLVIGAVIWRGRRAHWNLPRKALRWSLLSSKN